METINNFFMIHPGGVDCHVYQDIANQLSDVFNCYGIDNYNLYHNEKITSLQKLSEIYLKTILEIQKVDSHEPFYFLGWSLGGQIALQIASILESKGAENINVFLLDTLLMNDNLKLESLILAQRKEELQKIETNKDIYESEMEIFSQKISRKLQKTKVTLFKAQIMDPSYSEDLKTILKSLKYNNIENVVMNTSNLEVVDLKYSSHDNLIKDALIVEHVKNTQLIY